jgi:hypothetical protein
MASTGLSERTVTLYRDTSAKALNEELGSVRLTDLTASAVHRALSALASRSSDATAFQLEPSAHAPYIRTIVGLGISGFGCNRQEGWAVRPRARQVRR